MAAPYPDEVVSLTADAEAALRRTVECLGGYAVDPDVAALCSTANNFLADCEAVLEAVDISRGNIIQDRVPREHP